MGATNEACAHGNRIELYDEIDEHGKATGWKIPVAQANDGEVCRLCPNGVCGVKFLPGAPQEQEERKKLADVPPGDDALVVTFMYRNHRGERARRRVRPLPGTLRFTSTTWHPEPQWVFDGIDLEKGLVRTWALKDARTWMPSSELHVPVAQDLAATTGGDALFCPVTDEMHRQCTAMRGHSGEHVPQKTGHLAVECEFLCLPEKNPHHYVGLVKRSG